MLGSGVFLLVGKLIHSGKRSRKGRKEAERG